MKDLNAVGVQCFTNDRGKAMDGSEYMPLYDAMAEYDRPIWVHPTRGPNFPDYLTEDVSQYEIWWTVGWPYETSTFMARLVFAKLFDRPPNLKIITHQGGAMIPFFEGRVGPGWDQLGKRTSSVDYTVLLQELQKRPPIISGCSMRTRPCSVRIQRHVAASTSLAWITSCLPQTRLSIRKADRCISAKRSAFSMHSKYPKKTARGFIATMQ